MLNLYIEMFFSSFESHELSAGTVDMVQKFSSAVENVSA